MTKIIKIQLIYFICYAMIFYSIFVPLAVYCAQDSNVIYITNDDIAKAKAISPFSVHFLPDDLKAVEIMEKRHFMRVFREFSDKERLKNLEYELFGRIWEFTPQAERIKKLKLASSNVALAGTSLPYSISSKRNVKRMMNSELQLRKKDDVGLLDGFLRLMSPENYEIYRKYSDDMFYKYEK